MERLNNINLKKVLIYSIPLFIVVTLFLFIFFSLTVQMKSSIAQIMVPIVLGIYYSLSLVVGILFFKDSRIKVVLRLPILGHLIYGVVLFITSAYMGLILLPVFLFTRHSAQPSATRSLGTAGRLSKSRPML